tara:strand:- start:5087 stop:5800 length:714 start_codon:yes stop_codon:yes gene_type:complete
MQIQEMRAYIRGLLDIDSSDISDDILNRFISEGYDQVVYSEKRWPFYETEDTFPTVGNTSDYDLKSAATTLVTNTSGLRDIAALRTDDHIVTYIGRDDGDAVYPLDTSSSGDPYWWSTWAEKVRLYPTPSSVQTIYVRGYKKPASFGVGSVDGTSPSDFPEPFHILFPTYGAARAYEQQEDPGMAQQYYSIFARELDNLRARYIDVPTPQPLVLNNRSVSRWSSQSYMPNRLRYSWE